MSKAAAIRAVMTTTGDLTQAQIVERSGVAGAVVCTFLIQAADRDEVTRSGEKGEYLYRLNAAYKSSRKEPKKKPGKRIAKADRKKLRNIAKKAREPKQLNGNGALHALTIESVLASAKHLAAIVRDQVEGLDGNPTLTHAIESFERAEKIHAAAGAA